MASRRPKLNLTIDPQVIAQLKDIAQREHVSVSRLIEREMDRFAQRYFSEPARPLHVAEPRRELEQ